MLRGQFLVVADDLALYQSDDCRLYIDGLKDDWRNGSSQLAKGTILLALGDYSDGNDPDHWISAKTLCPDGTIIYIEQVDIDNGWLRKL